MLYGRVKTSFVSEPAYQVAGRVVAGGPVTCTAATASVQAVAVADRIAAKSIPLAWISRDPLADFQFFDKLARFHCQT